MVGHPTPTSTLKLRSLKKASDVKDKASDVKDNDPALTNLRIFTPVIASNCVWDRVPEGSNLLEVKTAVCYLNVFNS